MPGEMALFSPTTWWIRRSPGFPGASFFLDKCLARGPAVTEPGGQEVKWTAACPALFSGSEGSCLS